MSRLKEIRDYQILLGDGNMSEFDHLPVVLAMEICEYAHRNQKREDGEIYGAHPFRCFEMYRKFVGMVGKFVGIVDTDTFGIDKEKMRECGIPFDGVQELCLLHDVVEDTDFTIEDLEEIFEECNLKIYFELYIKKPLIALTHNKSEEYDDYIEKCLKYPSSALVKMIDMQDNLNVFTLISLDEDKYDRGLMYYHYIFLINNKYHFLEGAHEYKEEPVCIA